MHYSSHVSLAFFSVEHIMRDVISGWLIRYLHANGASFFFITVYLHIARGLYFGSFYEPRYYIWVSGILIFFLMMATAFIGYVLPWGQMSFWGATVITSLFSAIPIVGDSVVFWLWGGFSVDNPTLNRFFSLHYLLPFVITGVVFLHLILLHLSGSSNPLNISESYDRKSFFPYFYVKDLLGFLGLLGLFIIFVGFYPNLLGHSDNYIEANPLSTPTHIVPEWYFLPFYAILRSIPSKLGGFACMILAITNLGTFSEGLLDVGPRTLKFRVFSKIFYWLFCFNLILLTGLGAQPVEAPFILIGQLSAFYYFAWFNLIIPFLNFLEFNLIKYH